MHPPQRQRFQPRSSDVPEERHGSLARRVRKRAGRRLPAMFGVALIVALSLTLGGCATEERITDPSVYLGNPFHRPTESGFRDMARAGCGTMSLGDSTVDALLGANQAFDTLVSALYNGDISNDEFMNQVLLQHPAADANIHATGCIMDQLAQCFAETCKAEAAVKPQTRDAKNAEDAETIASAIMIDPSELPAEDRPQVDAMAEPSKEDGPKPLP